jgi:hypothetical protein
MATNEQLSRLDDLMHQLNVSPADYQKCLDTWRVAHPAELTQVRMTGILDQLEARLLRPAASGSAGTARSRGGAAAGRKSASG